MQMQGLMVSYTEPNIASSTAEPWLSGPVGTRRNTFYNRGSR